MSGLGRAIVLFAALSAGSWLGLGRPPLDQPRTWLHPPAAPSAPPAPSDSPSAHLPSDLASPPVDPANLPEPSLFPHLNPDETTKRAWLLAEGPAPAPGDGKRLVTLTFDDGPFPEVTPDILALLAKHHVRATFFWIGSYLDGDGDRAVTTRAVARTVVAAGHFVGNHTHDHAQLTVLSRERALAQIDDGARSIAQITGAPPVLFRPPYGAIDPWLGRQLHARGDELVLWSVEAADMTHGDTTPMVDSLKAQIEYSGGGVVLLHDARLTTIPVLASLLDWLDAHKWDPNHPDQIGYQIVDLAEYMQATARAPMPYPDRPALEHARALAWRRDHPHGRFVRASTLGESEARITPL